MRREHIRWVAYSCLYLLGGLGCTPVEVSEPTAQVTQPLVTPAMLEPIARVVLDAQPHAATDPLVSLGLLASGDAVTVTVQGQCVQGVYLTDSAGNIMDGGEPGQAFTYRVSVADVYYLYLDWGGSTRCGASVAAAKASGVGVPTRTAQAFVLAFNGASQVVLSGGQVPNDLPGMDLGVLSTEPDEQAYLRLIQPLIRTLIHERLVRLFSPYGMRVVETRDELGDSSVRYSAIVFTSLRGPEVSGSRSDVVPWTQSLFLVNLDSYVLYGTAGGSSDLGNRVPDDSAVVYTGSFGGANLDGISISADTMADALANAAAHEMAHLLGLQHVTHTRDIMWAQTTAALTDELTFTRSQVIFGDSLVRYLYQDPDRYLRRINGLPDLLDEPVPVTAP